MDKDYEVGYGKPPVETRFKEGQSGNKKGRPKGSKNVHTLLNEILSQKVSLKENDKVLKVSKKAGMLMQLVNQGLKGNLRAMDILLPYILESDIKAEEKAQILKSLNRDDKSIVLDLIKEVKELETCE